MWPGVTCGSSSARRRACLDLAVQRTCFSRVVRLGSLELPLPERMPRGNTHLRIRSGCLETVVFGGPTRALGRLQSDAPRLEAVVTPDWHNQPPSDGAGHRLPPIEGRLGDPELPGHVLEPWLRPRPRLAALIVCSSVKLLFRVRFSS